jgi:hypothetical protein
MARKMPRLIVQLPLSGGWGTEAEVAARDELAEALRDGFRAHGYGRFRGVEDGAGKTNIVLAQSASCDLDTLPVEYVRAELRARGLLDRAVIAYEVNTRGRDQSGRVRYVVVGGCGLGDDDPEWKCADCGHRWGRLTRPDPPAETPS